MWIGWVEPPHPAPRARPATVLPAGDRTQTCHTLHVGIEHFQGAAAGVDFVVMGKIGEPFEDAEQVLVPGAAQDLQIAGAALRAEWPEPRGLVAALCRRRCGEAAQRAHQMKRLALSGLPGILAEPDVDPLTVLSGRIEQQSLHVARVGPPAHRHTTLF